MLVEIISSTNVFSSCKELLYSSTVGFASRLFDLSPPAPRHYSGDAGGEDKHCSAGMRLDGGGGKARTGILFVPQRLR